MNLIRRDKGEDGRTAVVPEGTVESGDLGVVDSLDLFEINERRTVGAKHTVEFEEIERAACDVSLGSLGTRAIEVGLRREKKITLLGEPKLLLPRLSGRGVHAKP